jgi:DNA replication protein DnaC
LSLIPYIKSDEYTFEKYEVGVNHEPIKIIKSFVKGNKSFLTICGDTGRGKTHLAIATAVAMIKELQCTTKYYQIESMFDELKKGYNDNECGITVDQLNKTELLIIDDFGTHHQTDWENSRLDMLIDYRYIHELHTIVTANLSLKGIKDISQRIMSRLASGSIVTLKGEDYRISHHA